MEIMLNLEGDYNLNVSEDGGDAIESLDTETTRGDVTSPQVRASTDSIATTKASLSVATPTSGFMLYQVIFKNMMSSLYKQQEENEQMHKEMLKRHCLLQGFLPQETLHLQELNIQAQLQTLQANARNLQIGEQMWQTWLQQQQGLAQTKSEIEDTQHTPEHPGSGEIQLNEQLVEKALPIKGQPQEAPGIARQLENVPQTKEWPREAPQLIRHQQEGSQNKNWLLKAEQVKGHHPEGSQTSTRLFETPQDEERPQQGPHAKSWPNKVLHAGDRPPDIPKTGTPPHQEQQARGEHSKTLQVKEWPPEGLPTRDQLLGRGNWCLKVNCVNNSENQPAQNKNKVKKKREKGRWSWPKNGPKSPNLKQKWPKLPQKLLRTRFQKRHEGQRVCFHNTGKRTKWKMKNPRKLCFVQSFCISFC